MAVGYWEYNADEVDMGAIGAILKIITVFRHGRKRPSYSLQRV